MSLRKRFFGSQARAKLLLPEAERYLHILKEEMGFNKLPQLSRWYRNIDGAGSSVFVQSVFGQDLIQVTAAPAEIPTIYLKQEPSAELLFLTYNGGYAVWKITRDLTGTVTLTPYLFNILGYVDFFTPYTKRTMSVTQSMPAYNAHTCMIETDLATYIYNSIINYGAICYVDLPATSSYKHVLFGLRNSYEPPAFDPNATLEFNTNTAYMAYPRAYGSDAYVCSSRHNWMMYGGELIKDLEVWQNITAIRVQYMTVGGLVQTAKPTWPSVSNRFYTLAILNPDKYVGRGATVGIGNYEFFTHYFLVTGQELLFGDVVIDYTGNVSINYFSNLSDPCNWNGGSGWSAGGVWHVEGWGHNTGGIIHLINYDNLDNDDETFICMHVSSYTGGYGSKDVFGYPDQSLVLHAAEYNGWAVSGDIQQYQLCYRINGGSLITKNMGLLYWGYKKTWTSTGDMCTGIGWSISSSTTTTGFYGQRIIKTSCKITDSYILYTYVVQDYTGPVGTAHWFDEDDTNFTFNKRVLGVIDIATGTENEYEVNDAFLSDMYSSIFDEELASAIGFHLKPVTEED